MGQEECCPDLAEEGGHALRLVALVKEAAALGELLLPRGRLAPGRVPFELGERIVRDLKTDGLLRVLWEGNLLAVHLGLRGRHDENCLAREQLERAEHGRIALVGLVILLVVLLLGEVGHLALARVPVADHALDFFLGIKGNAEAANFHLFLVFFFFSRGQGQGQG